MRKKFYNINVIWVQYVNYLLIQKLHFYLKIINFTCLSHFIKITNALSCNEIEDYFFWMQTLKVESSVCIAVFYICLETAEQMYSSAQRKNQRSHLVSIPYNPISDCSLDSIHRVSATLNNTNKIPFSTKYSSLRYFFAVILAHDKIT